MIDAPRNVIPKARCPHGHEAVEKIEDGYRVPYPPESCSACDHTVPCGVRYKTDGTGFCTDLSRDLVVTETCRCGVVQIKGRPHTAPCLKPEPQPEPPKPKPQATVIVVQLAESSRWHRLVSSNPDTLFCRSQEPIVGRLSVLQGQPIAFDHLWCLTCERVKTQPIQEPAT